MKHTIHTDIENALQILGKTLPRTPEEIEEFIKEVDSKKAKIANTAFTPTSLAKQIVQNSCSKITRFPSPETSGTEHPKDD